MKIQLELSPQAIEFLDLLQKKLGFASREETLHYVLGVLKSAGQWEEESLKELANNFQVVPKLTN